MASRKATSSAAALQRHPIRDGKPQAKVLDIIGAGDTVGIENLYTATKYQFSRDWSEEALAGTGRRPGFRQNRWGTSAAGISPTSSS